MSLCHNNCFDHFALPFFPQDQFPYHLLSNYIIYFFNNMCEIYLAVVVFFSSFPSSFIFSVYFQSLYYFPLALLMVLSFHNAVPLVKFLYHALQQLLSAH